MNKLFLFILLITFTFNSFAANILKGYVVDENKNPIEGALVRWENSNLATNTDTEGYFELNSTTSSHMLEVIFVGYEQKIIHIDDKSIELHIQLKESTELKEVVVTKTVSGKIKNRVGVFQTEKLTTKELSRAACCNLSESFETNPSVDVAYSDAVTGAKQIQLLGLSGTYVQMLTENYPNMRGTSSTYGLDYVPGTWMESIQVSKGAASVKNGYESLTGQINIEYKKPKMADPLSVNLFTNSLGRYEANADGAIELNNRLSTGLFLHYSAEQGEHDINNDSFLDGPKKRQINLMNRWHYQTSKFISQSGIKVLGDERISGQTHNTIEDKSTLPYEISIKTNRIEGFTKNGVILDDTKNESIALILSGSYHKQKSKYDYSLYDVAQSNLRGSLMYERNFGAAHKVSTGLNLNIDKFTEDLDIEQSQYYNQPDGETTSGAYGEYTFNSTDKFIVLAGMRLDYSTLHRWFATPRVHLKYNVAQWLHLRASAGKGYKSVFVLPEYNYLLASSRNIAINDNLNQENACNYGLSASFFIPIRGEELSITGEWYYTNFSKQVVMDWETDAHRVNFYNLDGKSYANSFQIEASYPFFKGFTLLGAYRWMDVKTDYKGNLLSKALMSNYKALATASYETPLRKWQFDLTAQFNGGGRMPTPDTTNPLWEKNFKAYTILNAQISKFFRTWSIYVGGENMLNFKQKTPIISAQNPRSENFDATMVWGPTMGRMFYAGIRYTLPKQ